MKFPIALLISVLFISCQKKKAPHKAKNEASDQPKIVELAERYYELGRFSGSILIDKNDEILFNQSFGFATYEENKPFTKETSFKIGSLSTLYIQKVLTELISKKKIDLNSPVSSYLKDYSGKLTLGNLLEAQSPQTIETQNLVEQLIEKFADKSIENLLLELSDQLNLSNTYFKNSEKPASKGYLYLNQGNGLERIASPSYNLDSISISEGIKSTSTDLLKLIQASAIETISLDGYIKTDGFSYSIDKKEDLTIIILSNTRHPVAEEMTNSIKAILSNNDYQLPLQRKEIVLDSEILEQYAGAYQLNPNFNLKVFVANDSLFTMMGPNKIHLKPQSENQFFMDVTDGAIKFVKDENGTVNGAILLDGFLTGNKIEKVEE